MRIRPPGRRFWMVLGGCAAVGLMLWGAEYWRDEELATRMLAMPSDEVMNHPELVSYAAHEAPSVYSAHCAQCHGADMKGNSAKGAPNFTDKVWLYGTTALYEESRVRVFDIEQTILYGIRAGDPRGRNVTDMPAYGLRGMLTPTEITNVTQYLLRISDQPHLADAADSGAVVFKDKGMCGDCHTADGTGDMNYGAPNLTANAFNDGNDPKSIYRSIYYGVHHICPAWVGVLPLKDIRALAVYLFSISKPEPGDAPRPVAY